MSEAGMFQDPAASLMRRISTGNVQADHILGGGIPANSITILMGNPGTGKTVFAEQLLFHNASESAPGLYITTMSEPLPKVVRYLQHFDFYDENKLGTSIQYEDAGEELAKQGVTALLQRVRQSIRAQRPRFIVIDSFKAVHDLSESVSEMRRVVSELAGLLSAYDTTTLLVGEYAPDHIALYPEFAVADGIISLQRRQTGSRDERYLRVLKLRGSGYVEGLHAFRITEAGLVVAPRLVSPQVPMAYEPLMERVSTGVAGLDRLLDGGIWAGTNTLVPGAAGSGKTTLALSFVTAGLDANEPSLFMNFQENPSQLARTIRRRGLDLHSLERHGLHLRYFSPVELQIDSILNEMFELIARTGMKRVVLDGLTDLSLAASDNQRFHDYLYALVQQFASMGVTSLMTLERSNGFVGEWQHVSSITDVIIELGLDLHARPKRTLRVLKARGIKHDLAAHEFELQPEGITLVEPEQP